MTKEPEQMEYEKEYYKISNKPLSPMTPIFSSQFLVFSVMDLILIQHQNPFLQLISHSNPLPTNHSRP